MKTAIAEQLTDQAVELFIVPNFTREELADGPRIVVRTGGREVSYEQGPDENDVLIEVGVVGVTPQHDGGSEYREQEIKTCDGFDDLMESIIALFIPDGPLEYVGMAEHRFMDIEQVIQFDPQKLYTEGIWLSVIRLTYRDSRDD